MFWNLRWLEKVKHAHAWRELLTIPACGRSHGRAVRCLAQAAGRLKVGASFSVTQNSTALTKVLRWYKIFQIQDSLQTSAPRVR